MIRVYEFESIEDVKEFFGLNKDKWLTREQYLEYLVNTGVRPKKTLVGIKNFAEKNGVKWEKKGREYFFQLSGESPTLV